MFNEKIIVAIVMLLMLAYFLLASPALNDDGFHYEGFAEAAARGEIDFKNFYGFQGLSFLAVPVFWLTRSSISIIITSIILSLLSLPLAYVVGKKYHQSQQAGLFFMAIILLMPYTYTTMMRGFQEAALLFMVLLIIYGSIAKKLWTPLAWAMGGIVKPFAITLFPLWAKDFLLPVKSAKGGPVKSSEISQGFNGVKKKKIIWVAAGALLGLAYLGTSYWQTGHLINNAAINSYQGNFDTGNPPPLEESFTFGFKGFGRALANLFLSTRKILVSPLLLMLGIWYGWQRPSVERGSTEAVEERGRRNTELSRAKWPNVRLRKEFGLAIALNFLLVGSLTFSFPKYLLPMVTLLALMAIPVLMKNWLVPILVLADSWLVFKPIYDYFGHNFWPNLPIYLLPLILAAVLFFLATWQMNFSGFFLKFWRDKKISGF